MRFPLLRTKRGAVLVFVALGSFVLLGMAGLALDGGMAYITRAKLARAVDAASLAAARNLRAGQINARNEAFAVAAANGVIVGGTTTLTLTFGTNAQLQQTVSMRAQRTIPLLFSRALGHSQMTIAAVAEATVPPIDMVLVVDRSGSLATQNAWDDLQLAATRFVALFDDTIDQMGLVSFQIRAQDEVTLRHPFKAVVSASINAMNSAGDTNTGEGLRLGKEQFLLPTVRPGAAKVVVFFTDGRPTAFRGGPVGGGTALGGDRVIAIPTTAGPLRGWWGNVAALSMTAGASNPNGCGGANNCSLGGPPATNWTEPLVRAQARTVGLNTARAIRAQGQYVYTIALGNPSVGNPLLQPDLPYLRQMSNEDHNDSATQLAGKSYFAPTAADLDKVFQALAKDLLVRLSR